MTKVICDEQGTKTNLHLVRFLISMKCIPKVMIDGAIYIVVNVKVLVVFCCQCLKVIIIFILCLYRQFIKFSLFVVITLKVSPICKFHLMWIYFCHLIFRICFCVRTFFIRVFLSCEFSYFLSMSLLCKMTNWTVEFILLVKSPFSLIEKSLSTFYMPGLREIMLLDC